MIPKLHYISQGNSPKEHIENIQKACSAGAELVQLNVIAVSEKKHLKLAKEAREITGYFQTRLIINNSFKIAREVKADGVHLENAVSSLEARKHLYTWQIIGATANTLKDCETLIKEQVDYIILSPFKVENNTEHSSKALGINGFMAIIDALKTATPILGFGGISKEAITAILETGISGVAISEEITNDFDSIKVFHKLLKASVIDEQRHTF